MNQNLIFTTVNSNAQFRCNGHFVFYSSVPLLDNVSDNAGCLQLCTDVDHKRVCVLISNFLRERYEKTSIWHVLH